MASLLRKLSAVWLGSLMIGGAFCLDLSDAGAQPRTSFPAVPGTPGASSTFVPSGTQPFATPGAAVTQPGAMAAPALTTPAVQVTPGAGWDPYSTSTGIPSATSPYYAPAQPGVMGPGPMVPNQPPSLFPQGAPFRPNPGYYGYTQQDSSLGQWRRFLSEIRLEHTWIYGPSASANMQMNVTELSGTFAIPFLYNSDSPLLITPGFVLNLFDGPTVPTWPPRTYDGYVDLAWKPHITPQISGDLGARVSASSDFSTLNADAIRYMGRGVGILTFSPNLQIALGVVYLDRQNIKLLPAGGVVWTPNPDLRADILFPNPKISKRLRDFGTTEVWGYVAGEYGGGSWNVPAIVPMGSRGNVDYNDIRASVGIEWTTLGSWRGHLEVGYVFEREIYASKAVNFPLGDSFMVRGGVAF